VESLYNTRKLKKGARTQGRERRGAVLYIRALD
jgi:hypothetical protein